MLTDRAQPTNQVLTLKSPEELKKIAGGKSTKIIIPSEIQNLGGLVAKKQFLIYNYKIDYLKKA